MVLSHLRRFRPRLRTRQRVFRMATQKAILYLIKPSQYDDDGYVYVVRHWRGVLPSNTLACLAALTEDLLRRKSFGDSWEIRLRLYDETVDRIPVSRICRSGRRRHSMTIVCLSHDVRLPPHEGPE
jgi:hypothetical protein